MNWWGWLIIGFVLMGAELTAVDAAFYLIFVGAAAILMGILGLVGVSLPIWAQWVLFAVLAVGSMVLFRQKLYDRLRGGAAGFDGSAAGATVAVKEVVPPGGRTRVRLRGSQWTAVNVGAAPIAAGADARVVESDGLELRIEGLSREPIAD